MESKQQQQNIFCFKLFFAPRIVIVRSFSIKWQIRNRQSQAFISNKGACSLSEMFFKGKPMWSENAKLAWVFFLTKSIAYFHNFEHIKHRHDTVYEYVRAHHQNVIDLISISMLNCVLCPAQYNFDWTCIWRKPSFPNHSIFKYKYATMNTLFAVSLLGSVYIQCMFVSINTHTHNKL